MYSGFGVNSTEELTKDCLGKAGSIYEHVLGEEKYTFVEDVQNPHSCTILIKGPADHTLAQIKEAIRDGLRAVKNTIEDGAIIPGAGAFEVCVLNRACRGSITRPPKRPLVSRAPDPKQISYCVSLWVLAI